jgi:alpha-tubulin suppressor-like RCC1 family protein
MTTGSNSYGQLGHGDVQKRYAFTRVESLRGIGLATVDCGEDHTGAVAGNGRLYLWGRGDWGQLGSGDGRSHRVPAPVNGVSVAPPVAREHFRGYNHECDVDENERVRKEKEASEREMGGPHQHLVNDAAAAVYD